MTSYNNRKSDQESAGLRSEKVRSILGSKPKALVRWAYAVPLLILLLLALVVCLVPYPYGQGETILQHIL